MQAADPKPLTPRAFMLPMVEEMRRDINVVYDFRSEQQKLADEYRRRLDLEFLGLDPDYRPPRWKEPLFAYRRWRRNLPVNVHYRRERLAKLVAPWLLNEWEASDRYDDY